MDLPPAQLKAFNLRGVVAALRERNLQDPVVAALTGVARDLVVDPPATTAWIDATAMNEIYVAIATCHGETVLKEIARAAMDRGAMVVLRPVIEGTLRLFGVSPHTLLSRIPTMSASNTRGYEYVYERIDDRSAWVSMTVPSLASVPRAAFLAFGASLGVVFDLTRLRGTIGEPEYIEPSIGNAARVRVSW